jgi:hypothetical protein
MFKVFSVFLGAIAFSSCIQLPVGPQKITKHKNVVYEDPRPNFVPTDEFTADRSWINNTTGTIISYKSECSSNSQPAELFLKNLSSEFYPAKLSEVTNFSYNSRKALRQSVETEIEGIATIYDLVVFKKYGCLFLISHSGVSKTFSKTEPSFEAFLNSFKVKR